MPARAPNDPRAGDRQKRFGVSAGLMMSARGPAMFPKVASKGTLSRRQKTLFMQSFGYTAVFVAGSVVGCFLLPGLLARILFGIVDPSPYLKHMIGFMALVMGISALLNVTVQFLLSKISSRQKMHISRESSATHPWRRSR